MFQSLLVYRKQGAILDLQVYLPMAQLCWMKKMTLQFPAILKMSDESMNLSDRELEVNGNGKIDKIASTDEDDSNVEIVNGSKVKMYLSHCSYGVH